MSFPGHSHFHFILVLSLGGCAGWRLNGQMHVEGLLDGQTDKEMYGWVSGLIQMDKLTGRWT